MGSKMKLWTIHVHIRVPEAIGLDVPNFVKNVPNFPKRASRWGSATNHFLMGSQMKLWILGDKIEVPKEIGWDVPNFTKDVPNFVKDMPKVLRRVPRWGLAMNHFLMCYKRKLWTLGDRIGVPKEIGWN